MTQEIYNIIFDKFRYLYEIRRQGMSQSNNTKIQSDIIVPIDSPITWMLTYFNTLYDIFNYLDTINIEWCKDYRENIKKQEMDVPIKLPTIYIDFKILIDNLLSENYEECDKIKQQILNDYK